MDDDPLDGKDGCTFLVGLMQKDARKKKQLRQDLETIGFAIYKVFSLGFILVKIACLSFYIRITINVNCLFFSQVPDEVSTGHHRSGLTHKQP